MTLTVLGASRFDGNAYCGPPHRFEEDALALLDLARFGEGGPEFASSVDVWLDGELVRTLNAEQAGDPAEWGDPSPLTRMLAALEVMMRANGRLVSPTVWSSMDRGDQFACGPSDPPAPLSGRKSTVVSIGHNTDGRLTQCHWVRIYRNQEGQVDAVSGADMPWPADEIPPVETEAPRSPPLSSKESPRPSSTSPPGARHPASPQRSGCSSATHRLPPSAARTRRIRRLGHCRAPATPSAIARLRRSPM